MADEDATAIVELEAPTQCVLWEHPERVTGKFADLFEEVETFEDSSHLTRVLYKCRECGHLYFFEWHEWVDWDGGHDKTYSTLIPVRTPEEAAALKQTNQFGLMRYFPRLHLDGKPTWVGKG